jgi:hypothetical protein
VVTTAPDAVRAGYDPIAENPRDPLRRPMNHPRIWTLLQHLGLSERHTVPLGFGLAAAFLAAVLALSGRLTIGEGIFYSVLVCSPATLMAVERGNVDVLLFCLLAVATGIVRNPRTHLWGVPAGFHLRAPEALPGVRLRARATRATPHRLVVLAGAAAAFGAYLLLTRHDVAAILSNSIQGIYLSYGRKVLLERLRDYGIPLEPSFYSAVVLVIAAAVAVLLALRTRGPAFTEGAMEKMLVGLGIYCGSFALLSNFNYRLIFLLFAVPQLLAWRRMLEGPSRRFASAGLAYDRNRALLLRTALERAVSSQRMCELADLPRRRMAPLARRRNVAARSAGEQLAQRHRIIHRRLTGKVLAHVSGRPATELFHRCEFRQFLLQKSLPCFVIGEDDDLVRQVCSVQLAE